MKIVCISDTHEAHDQLSIPECDILFHAGDFSYNGKLQPTINFLEWLNIQPAKHIVLIAGNHDWMNEKQPELFAELLQKYAPNVHYLNDSGITIEGFKIWGSPINKWFYSWAFNRLPGPDIQKHWNLIPKDTNILLLHGPPYGILDQVNRQSVGDKDLLDTVGTLTELKLMIFGHIHPGFGRLLWPTGTIFINAAVMNDSYQVVNEPQVIILDEENT